MDVFCLFGVSSCHFGRPQNLLTKLFFRHLRGVYWNEISTKSKEIQPVVEEQEEQQSTDGTDGPSKFTDPAVSPAPDLTNN